MELGKKYTVWSVRKADNNGAAVWIKAGYAFANRDGSTNVWLDVLPLDGKLHIREAGERRELAGTTQQPQQPKQSEEQSLEAQSDSQFMGGH